MKLERYRGFSLIRQYNADQKFLHSRTADENIQLQDELTRVNKKLIDAENMLQESMLDTFDVYKRFPTAQKRFMDAATDLLYRGLDVHEEIHCFKDIVRLREMSKKLHYCHGMEEQSDIVKCTLQVLKGDLASIGLALGQCRRDLNHATRLADFCTSSKEAMSGVYKRAREIAGHKVTMDFRYSSISEQGRNTRPVPAPPSVRPSHEFNARDVVNASVITEYPYSNDKINKIRHQNKLRMEPIINRLKEK